MSHSGERKSKVSFINWFICLIVSIIPGVNILFYILTALFARNGSKRSWACASLVFALLIVLIVAVGLYLALYIYKQQVFDWIESVLKTVPETVTPPVA